MDITNILFKSEIRRKILARFFAGEDRRFYINEMARLVGTTQGTCRRELNKLADAGILIKSKEGNLQYYEVNKQYPFHKEFSTIIHKTIGIDASIKEALKKIEGIEYSFIFGSYAKKEFKPESDIDLVVVGDIKEDDLIKTLKDVEKSVEREINHHIYSAEEFKRKVQSSSFMKNIIRKYIMVSGDERRFRKLLKQF